jgi:hypothetical protein
LGLLVRRIEANGFVRVERLGGVPQRVLPGLRLVIMNKNRKQIPYVIGIKAHHATSQDEKSQVLGYDKLFLDLGAKSADEVRALGVEIGAPVATAPPSSGWPVRVLSGARTPINDPRAKGLIFGLTLAHRRGDIYRALIEGIGHATRHNLDGFAGIQPARSIYAAGGGVQNSLWTQCVSDIAGIRQNVRQPTVGAALGSAFLAGIGCGIFVPEDIDRTNPIEFKIAPNEANRNRYDADHVAFKALYANNRAAMRRSTAS